MKRTATTQRSQKQSKNERQREVKEQRKEGEDKQKMGQILFKLQKCMEEREKLGEHTVLKSALNVSLNCTSTSQA